MKLRSLAVNQFKKFTSPTRLAGLEDGLNLVVGPNEMGKSTLLDALRAVLFEKYSSRAQPILSLRNARNDAAPVVELEFELNNGPYRITKRFVRKPYARLACPDGRSLEGDVAEDTLRDLLHFHEPGKTGAKPETLGMWNVLWVQQGQSFGALDLPASARSSLRSALESEVGTVLGGRRGRKLPAVIEGQLGELVTTAQGRPRGAYKDLIERVAALGQELDGLRARRLDLTQTLDDLEDVEESLRRLAAGERDRADREELDQARERHARLAELEARIEAAGVERKLGINALAEAERAAAERERLRADVETGEAALQTADRDLLAARERDQEARSKVDGLRTETRRTEAAARDAEEAVSRRRRVLGTVERHARLRELEQRHGKAEAADGRRREAEQAAAAILLNDHVIEAIRKASQACDTHRSRLDSVATRVVFEMDAAGMSGVKVDDEPLTAERRSVQAVEPVTITIPDRGRITVEPAASDRDQLLRRERDAEAELRAVLEQAGARSVTDAEDQYTRRQKLVEQAQLARQEAEVHAPATDDHEAGAQALAVHVEGLRQVVQREMAELDVQELPARQEAEDALRSAERQADEARSAHDTARAALRGPEELLGELQREIGTLQGGQAETTRRLEKLQAEVAQAEAARPDESLQADIRKARTTLAEREAAIAGLEARRGDETVPQLDARIGRLERAIQDRRGKRDVLNERRAGLRSRVEFAEGAGLDEAIKQQARELELAEEERSRQDREVEVLTLLLSTLRSAERKAMEQYVSPVLKRVRPYLQILFPGADIRIDEKLHIHGVVRETGYEDFKRLSKGTQEQVAVLVRLAFAEMLVEQGHPATVVLDDALVFSDDPRMGRIFDILNMAASNVQVIVFTCREQLFEGLGGRQLTLEPAGSDELASA